MKLFSKYSNLCDQGTLMSQTDRETDGLTICRSNTALCAASRGNKTCCIIYDRYKSFNVDWNAECG